MADDARASESRSRLGRGLASLIGDTAQAPAAPERPRAQRRVPIEFLRANPRNPRRTFAESELGELSASIRQHGVIQPIVVRPVKGASDRFEIIAGERRWRAAQAAGLHDVPIVPVDVGDADALEIAIIENVQRADLNAIEEAEGYQALIGEFKRTQDDVARIVGKSRSHVANTMRLLKLPADVRARISAGELTAGHARALIGVPDPATLAARIVAEGLTVRQAEALAQEAGVPSRKKEPAKETPAAAPLAKDADTLALEKRVSDVLGMKVSVSHRDPGGTVMIHYRDLEQLDDILRRLDASR
jgi:ParB family chromosome partitioning protein